jgi:hypothetical protein
MVLAAPPTQPSDRACLIAWNSPANHANRVKLLAARPMLGLMLQPAVVYTVTWTKTSSKQTGGPACVLTIMKRNEIRNVTGRWKSAGVTQWTFGRPIRTNKINLLAANVRLLPDGRVTKIYRR